VLLELELSVRSIAMTDDVTFVMDCSLAFVGLLHLFGQSTTITVPSQSYITHPRKSKTS